MSDKTIATFQVSVRIMGAFSQELVILSQVHIPEFEAYILDDPNRDEILLNRAKSNIIDYVKAGQLIGRIVKKTKELIP